MEPGWASLTYWGPFQGPGRSRWSKAGGREARMPPTGLVTRTESHQTRITCFSMCQAFPLN